MAAVTTPIRWANLENDLASDLADDFQVDPDSAVEVVDSSPDMPQELFEPVSALLLVLVGTVAIGKLAQVVTAFTCRLKKQGLIIDVRGKELNVTPRPELPGGTVILLAKDGSSETIDVCKGEVNLDQTIEALLGGASASSASSAI